MFDWLLWFTTMEHSKPLALVLFFSAFCGIVFYVFTGKDRAKRLESYKYLPFADEEPLQLPEWRDSARKPPVGVGGNPIPQGDGQQL